MIAKTKFLHLVELYFRHYHGVGVPERKRLLPAADAYQEWFLETFIPWLETQLTIKQGVWQMDDAVAPAIVAAGKQLRDAAATIIVRPAVEYTTTYFKEFW